MAIRGPLSVLCLVFVGVLVADEQLPPPKEGKLLKEVWEAAFLEGSQAGYAYASFREMAMGENPNILASTEMELNLVRFGQNLQLKFGMSDVETPAGKMLGFVVHETKSKSQVLVRKGKIEGKQVTITAEMPGQEPKEVKFPWNDKALGLYAQERLFAEKKPEPNTKFDFIKFEPMLDTWLTIHVQVQDFEEVALLDGMKKKLLRVETRIQKMEKIPEFPPEIAWLDETGEALKRQSDLPGLGTLMMFRTTKELAQKRGGKAPVDVGVSQLVRVNRVMSRPNDTREVVYKVRIKGEQEPQSVLPQDDRQSVRAVKQDAVELVVQGQQQPQKTDKPTQEPPPAEYLKSNATLRSADVRVKELARRAVDTERDPWQKALRIESWVQNNMKNKNFTEAFATADEVARTLEGDCTEHAVLAAAMCRAVGVPSRTVIGLVHVPTQRAMGFHMWIEVWNNGKWYALDPTLGQGRVGAAHIKITDQHWNDTQSLLPFLPLTRVLGKLEIEVLEVKYE